MKQAILLAGIPGTGKTTIAKALIESLGGFSKFSNEEPVQLVNCLKSEDLVIIGKYDDSEEVFQGTDRLSMAVSPNFQKYIEEFSPERLFIEGDRLVGNKTIDFLLEVGYNTNVLVVEVPDDVRLARYRERGSDQSEKFIQSKITKVSNISSRLDLIMEDSITTMSNVDSSDLERIVYHIIEKLELL